MDENQNTNNQYQPPTEPSQPVEPSSPAESSPFAPPIEQVGPVAPVNQSDFQSSSVATVGEVEVPQPIVSPQFESPSAQSEVPQFQPQAPLSQPQPFTQQPQAPAPPAPPISPIVAPMPNYQMPVKKGMSKGLIRGIIAGSVSLVVLIVGAIVAWNLLVPNKADYTEANKTVESISKERLNITGKISSLLFSFSVKQTTDTVFDNDVQAAEKSLKQMKDDLEQLKKSKAVRFGEPKTKFNDMDAKLSEAITWYDNAIVSFKSARVAISSCSSENLNSSNIDIVRESLASCIDALKNAKDIKNPDVKEYISKGAEIFDNMAAILDKMAAIPERDIYGSRYSEFSSLSNQMLSLSNDTENISNDFNSNFEKHSKEIDPATSITQLNEALYQAGGKS